MATAAAVAPSRTLAALLYVSFSATRGRSASASLCCVCCAQSVYARAQRFFSFLGWVKINLRFLQVTVEVFLLISSYSTYVRRPLLNRCALAAFMCVALLLALVKRGASEVQ